MAKGTVSDQKKSDPKKPVLDEQTLDKLLEAAFVIQEQGDLKKQTRNPATAGPASQNRLSTGKVPATPIAASSAAATTNSAFEKLGAEKIVAEKIAPEKPAPKKSAAEKSSAPETVPAGPVSISPAGIGAASIGKDAYTLTLGQIVETQQQILTRRLELESAMALVAQRAAEITGAAGSAIGIIEAQTDENQTDEKKTDAKKLDGKRLRYRAVSGLLTLPRGSEVAMEKALCFNCLRSGEVIRGADVNSDFLLDAEECRRRGIGSLIAVPIYRDSGIAGALELYFAGANAFREQDVHSSQLMAGLVTEALARDAGVSSRKSLAAERATMLEALEKLRPNLAALMESPALKESVARSAAPKATAANAIVPLVTTAGAGVSAASPSGTNLPAVSLPAANPSVANSPAASVPAGAPAATIPKKPVAPAFFCRKCGHELVGEEMFCGKCGSPRSSEYQPPTMQSKLASLWQMQQAGKQNAVPANGSVRAAERRINPGVPVEIQPWEAVLSELEDPFGEPEPEATPELEGDWKPAPRTPQAAPLPKEVIEISAAARKFASQPDAPVEQTSVHAESMRRQSLDAKSIGDQAVEQEVSKPVSFEADSFETDSFEADAEAELEADGAQLPGRGRPGLPDSVGEGEKTAAPAGSTALANTHPLAWSSAARAKEAFERLAASRNQNSFVRFWNTRRGDVYLAVAVVLVAAVIRWSIWSEHSFGANGSAAKVSHHRPAPDADLSTFDKLLISVGLADPPDPVEDKGNPDTQVWVDLHSALYYCPGADLYGKTPQGKYSSQRDAQLGQFEPAYRKPCE
jgi:GAF domain-containing protein